MLHKIVNRCVHLSEICISQPKSVALRLSHIDLKDGETMDSYNIGQLIFIAVLPLKIVSMKIWRLTKALPK